MHEYLSYFSPTLKKMINLGSFYDCPIQENGLRDYSLGYTSTGSRIISFNNDKIVKKQITVRWSNDLYGYRRSEFHDAIMSDVTAGIQGRLYDASKHYIECNIIEYESSNNFGTKGFSDAKYTIVTDDYTWKKDAFLTTDKNARYITQLGSSILDIDLIVKIKRTDGKTGAIGNILAMWYDDVLERSHTTRYGLAESVNCKMVVIDTAKRIIVDEAGNNLFSKRYKLDLGTFWTPKRHMSLLTIGPIGDVTIDMDIKIKKATPGVVNLGNHVGLTDVDSYGPHPFDPADHVEVWESVY